MTNKLLALFLFSSILCFGQAVPTPAAGAGETLKSAPESAVKESPTRTQSSSSGAAVMPGRSSESHAEGAVVTTRAIGPLSVRSEFELFAEDTVGHPVQVYGRRLFDQVPTTFAPMDQIPVPVDYVLGPGDELLIRAWGKIDLDSRFTVDRNGQIFLPKVGALTVAGLPYKQIESFLRSAIGNLYKDFELNVTMGQLRTIQIFVLGSARQPGAYTVGSLSTLVDALFASGGPSATGTMRRIQLRRGAEQVSEFDIYDLLRNGDKSHDVQLLAGDVIYIPPAGPQVAIMGSVNEPAIYELKGETTIASALKSAGGLTNLAGLDRVLLEKIENHRRRRVDEFALDIAGMQRELNDGDMLRIFPISPQFENAVTLRGNVIQTGRFSWREGMRISDLIPSRNLLITRGYWNQQNERAGNTSVDPFRNLQINDASNGLANAYQSSFTAKAPTDMMADLGEINAEINWEYASIERLNERDLSTQLIAVNLGSAIDNPTSADNQLLKPGDILTIFSRKDIPLPTTKHASFVRVAGEVNAPGVYRVNPGETLREIVTRAGGLTKESYLYASLLTRASVRAAQEEQLRISIQQMQRDYLARTASVSSLTPAAASEQQQQLRTQQALVSQLAAVRPIGRVVLDISSEATAIDDIPAFPLEDGDAFYIPQRPSTVLVAGAVYNENAFRYQSHKKLSGYLNDAGGATRQADAKRTFLIRADGTVISAQNKSKFWHGDFNSLILRAGDAIFVPTKIKLPNSFTQQLPFYTQLMSQAALTGAVISTTF